MRVHFTVIELLSYHSHCIHCNYYSNLSKMVFGRPNRRDLAIRRRWQGKNVQDRLHSTFLKKLGAHFLMIAAMLPIGIFRHVMRVQAMIVHAKHQEIESWENLPADKVEVTDVTIDGCSEEECYSQFRFLKRDLRHLYIALRFPDRIVLDNKSVILGEKAFLMMLYRMAYPRRLVDLEAFFGREYSTVSRCFTFVVNKMDDEHSHLIADNLDFFLPRFPEYNRVIKERIALSNNNMVPDRECMTAFFLDGTKREICRPLGNNNMQRAVYDGRLREHNLGFQGMSRTCSTSLSENASNIIPFDFISGLSAPDGIIMDLFGPIAGRHHDMIMVRESNINSRIRDVQLDNDQQYVMYADKGYVDMTHLIAAYHGAELTVPQIQINGILALVRVSVEWCFGKITESQKYIDFPRSQQTQLQPVAKYYRLSTLLMNANTCLYGSQTSLFFGLKPPTLGEYFDCVDAIPV
jgi:nuclease HARBI1